MALTPRTAAKSVAGGSRSPDRASFAAIERVETLRVKNDSTGTVKVTSGSKVLCTTKVKVPKLKCRITAKAFSKGAHTVTFNYGGPKKASSHVRMKITVK